MKIINQRKISVLWHLICFSLVLAFAACSDDKEEFQEYLTPASGSESIFEQGFSFGEAASSQSVSFEAGQQWTAEWRGYRLVQHQSGKRYVRESHDYGFRRQE